MIRFPETDRTFSTFQESSIPAQCRAFSHLIISTPEKVSGRQMQQEITEHARKQGADMLLIGMVREHGEDDNDAFSFTTYGPKAPYVFDKHWQGWRFGFEEWNDGGDVVSFGTSVWNDGEYIFPRALYIQAVYLTCQVGPQIPKQ